MKQLKKEMAVQSVGADGQPSVSSETKQNQLDQSIPFPRNKHKSRLKLIDGESLMTTSFPRPRFVVENLLPQGLHLLAGSPKVGKSWLALWLCIQVSKGEPVWSFDSNQGAVLYLALEDSEIRLQDRAVLITDYIPSCLKFSTLSSGLHDGLCEEIRLFCSLHADARLVVIDTLQRVRGNNMEPNSYAGDYHDLALLKSLADELGIAILLIHHLRKEYDADPFNRISGTIGLSAATDSNFALVREKRGEKKATLHCSGRDIEDRELELEFDRQAHTWNLIHDSVVEPEKFLDPAIGNLISFVKSTGTFRGTVSELLEALAPQETINPNALSRRIMQNLSQLAEHGVTYDNHRTGSRREIVLSHDANDADDGNSVCGPVSETSSPSSSSSQVETPGL